MRIGLNYITALLPAGAASMAIAVAPKGPGPAHDGCAGGDRRRPNGPRRSRE
jgi:hypothetical protein